MAKRLLNVDVPESNVVAEIDLEETIQFKVLISKLKDACNLNSGDEFFIKTSEGDPVRESDAIKLQRGNNFIMTKDRDWKPVNNGKEEDEIDQVSGSLIADEDGNRWFLPFSGKASWTDLNLLSQLFELENIAASKGEKIAVKVLVQYSMIDTSLAERQKNLDRVLKMKQILSDTLNIELPAKDISSKNFPVNADTLEGKMRQYLSSHMELKWGTRIDCISIVAYLKY